MPALRRASFSSSRSLWLRSLARYVVVGVWYSRSQPIRSTGAGLGRKRM